MLTCGGLSRNDANLATSGSKRAGSTAAMAETAYPFLEGGGTMGAHIRALDWSATAIGDPSGWPQALRTVVRLMLNTRHPMYIFWGPEGTCLYNDAYSHSIGPERHPGSLGRPAREVWDEIWPIIGPQIEQVMAGGEATWYENALVPITRHGKREDVYWTYSYGPIDDDTAPNGVGGVLVVCSETTEHVRTTRRVLESRERMTALLEQAPSFMAVFDGPDHVFDIVNNAYTQLIGHRDVIGKPARTALPEIADQGFINLLDRVYASGEAYVGNGITAKLQREPGAPLEERFIDLVIQPVRGDDDAVTGVFVQGHDITDQKRAELAASESEARFRRLAQSMPNHVWTAYPDGMLDWFNVQVYAYSGAKPGDLDGDKWAMMVHPHDIGPASEVWASALHSGTPYEIEFRLRRHDGVYRWFIARAVPLLDPDGTVERWVGTNTDIEEQKEAEAALRESDLRVKLALDAADIGVWQCFVVDGEFVEPTGDDRAMKLLGATPGETSTFAGLLERIHPDDRDMLVPAARAALDPAGDGLMSLEYRLSADGRQPERWVQVRAQTVAGEGGLRLVGTARDITARKNAEVQQQVVSAELQHRIKNTLAMVGAIASQTLRGDDIADRRNAFNDRLGALARAQDMLMTPGPNSAQLRDVIEAALEAHRTERRPVDIRGPDIELSARQGVAIALATHELATNAAKYGALSVDGGRVTIDWSTDGQDDSGGPLFTFVWRESDGPPVRPPSRSGFGSRLITRVLPNDFGGEVKLDYENTGVVCQLVAPLKNLRPERIAKSAGER